MDAIIIHGTQGSPQGNWFPWLSQELRKLGLNVIVPTMPTPENQSLESWLAALSEQCPPATSETILIGHSCGAVLCMRLLEKLPNAINCTVLVAPPYKAIGRSDIDALNSSFLEAPFNWRKIKENAGQLAYFMADNDQYVPQDQLLAIADGLNVVPIIIPGGGHLNAETGYDTFPLLLELLKEVVEEGEISTDWCERGGAPNMGDKLVI